MPAIDWPIYVINLDRAVERRAAVTTRLNRAGLSFERFPAVDARDLTAERIGEVVAADQIRYFKRALSRPEIACYLSHIAVWRAVAVGDKPAAFIFEDDVDFVDDGPQVLQAVSSRPPDWDMLKFYADRDVELSEHAPLLAGYSCGVPYPQPMHTVAYAITRNAAAHLAELAVPFSMPIDMEFRSWWRFNACVKLVSPSPFRPARDHESTSKIAPSRKEHRTGPFWRRFVRHSRYQLGYHLGRLIYRRRMPRRPAWPQAL